MDMEVTFYHHFNVAIKNSYNQFEYKIFEDSVGGTFDYYTGRVLTENNLVYFITIILFSCIS